MRYLISILLVLTLAATPALGQEAAPAVAAPAAVPAVVPAVAPAPADVAAPAAVDAGAVAAPPADGVVPVKAADGVAAPDAVSATAPDALKGKTAVPETNEDAGAMVVLLLDAANSGHWTLFGGLLILLLMFGFNRMGLAAKIGKKYVPWATLAVGCLVGVAVGLAEGATITDALKLGLLEGGLAIALWELVAKHMTGKKSDGSARVTPTADATA